MELDQDNIIYGFYGPSIVPAKFNEGLGRIKKNLELEGYHRFAHDFHLVSDSGEHQRSSLYQYFNHPKFFR